MHWIEYGGNRTTGTPMRYMVTFNFEKRKDGNDKWHDDGPVSQHRYIFSLWESYRVHSIRAGIGNCEGNNIIHEYVLRYDTPTLEWPGYEWTYLDRPPKPTLLAAVQQYGQGGEAGGHSLPVIDLRYTYYEQADKHLLDRSGVW